MTATNEPATTRTDTNSIFARPVRSGDQITIPAAVIRTADGAVAADRIGHALTARPAGALVINGSSVRWKVPFNLNKAIMGGQIVGIAYFAFAWLTERSNARVALKIGRLQSKGDAN